MKLSIEIAAVFAALAAFAFDSADWLDQRRMLDYEAERLCSAYAKYSEAATEPAESIAVPVEGFPDGSVKTSISAKKAQFFLNDGFIWGDGVEVREFKRDGSLEAKIDADNCVVDRTTRSGWVEGHAHAEFRGEFSLDGDKVYFSAPEEYLKIFTNTVLKADGRVLRSMRADYDHQNGVAMFDGDVVLRGTEGKNEYVLKTDQAFAFISSTNELKRVVALGNVRVKSGQRVGRCDRAVYTKGDSKIVMYGEENGRSAMLADISKNRSRVEGSRITFWINNEQVEVVDSKITVDASGIKPLKGGKGL